MPPTATPGGSSRLRALLELVDLVRIDHFRAFVDYWEVPAGSPTAADGRWAWGPGAAFFRQAQAALRGLPIVAEDLGELHPEVPALLEETGLPGMKVLQFAYDGDPENPFLPEYHSENCVVYTGTHDNDTTVGWYGGSGGLTRSWRRSRRSTSARSRTAGESGPPSTGTSSGPVFVSVADTAIVPLQDVLGAGGEARMNLPGRPGGNWRWRFAASDLTPGIRARLRAVTEGSGRCLSAGPKP